ncbi:uncharacterized protein LOC100679652 [Nasonia vitripennis]|uniref:Uncharacterized protein n=1 Tax=Nasonia vitripennis TaxID=7425 RepID=A0A7M7T933_NASVI|nr:uncharacterized protein LOC100679652 [Nasonia vitripennis]
MCRIWISGALCLGLALGLASGQICSGDKIRKCIAVGEPMMKDPNQIFPDNLNDINSVCRKWSNFVDCIRRYIDKCLSKLGKEQFNSAVEPPISSVHHMCSDPAYQAEYLQYAGCMKSTVVEAEHCGGQYSVLLGEVSREPSRKPNLCCAYHSLRSCVISKTRLRCDANRPDGSAAKFARQVLDKALRISQEQCLNYTHEPGRCSAMTRSSRLGEGRSVSLELLGTLANNTTLLPRLSSVRTQLGSSQQPSEDRRAAKPEATHRAPIVEGSVPLAPATQRPSSYGRAISWTTPTTPTTPATPATPATSEIPDWATNTWLTHGQDLTTEEIYPAAGSFGGSNVDEPNQQGLSRSGQQPLSVSVSALLCTLIVCAHSMLVRSSPPTPM